MYGNTNGNTNTNSDINTNRNSNTNSNTNTNTNIYPQHDQSKQQLHRDTTKFKTSKTSKESNGHRTHMNTHMNLIMKQIKNIKIDNEQNTGQTDVVTTHPCGIIIVDEMMECDENFKYCGSRIGSVTTGGFAPYDVIEHWYNVDIPVIMITKRSGDILKKMLGVIETEVPGYGSQLVVASTSAASGQKIQPKRNIEINPIIKAPPQAQIVKPDKNSKSNTKSNTYTNTNNPHANTRFNRFNGFTEHASDMSRRDLLNRGTWKESKTTVGSSSSGGGGGLNRQVEMDMSGLSGIPAKPSNIPDPNPDSDPDRPKRSIHSRVSHSIADQRTGMTNKLLDRRMNNDRRV